MDEHNVEKILSEMLNSLVHARDPKPLIFMVIKLILKDSLDQVPSQSRYRAGLERSWNRGKWSCTSTHSYYHISYFRCR